MTKYVRSFYVVYGNLFDSNEAKSEVPGWGIGGDKVNSGIGLPMVNVLESTLELT